MGIMSKLSCSKTLGVIMVDKNKKQVLKNGEKVKFKPGLFEKIWLE